MSNNNILDEYLVKLGFSTDTVGFAKFAGSLRDAESLVDNSYFKMAKKVLEFQIAGVGAFAAFGGAVVGLAEKVAMADQDYRLLALHMFTSLPVARELKVALDALGQPLENVMWDPELAARFHQLVKDQQELTSQLGPGFEDQMLKIRDVRFEFTRFGVELKYLSMFVVQDLAKAFGTDVDGLLRKFRDFNAWFISHMPEISQWIVTRLKPILIEVKDVLFATGGVVKELSIDFIHLVGLLGGDQKLANSKGGFDDLAQSILEVVKAIKIALIELTQFEKGLALVFSAADKALHGDFGGAYGDLKEINKATSAGAQAAGTGLVDGGSSFIIKPHSLVDKTLGGAVKLPINPNNIEDVKKQIIAVAHQFGIAPELALAIAQQESGFKEYGPDGKVLTNPKSGAQGVMQLMPQTAKGLGVNAGDIYENIFGGLLLLNELLHKYGDEATALAHYGGRGGPESQQYAKEVMAREHGMAPINVTVHAYGTNATPEKIGEGVRNALEGIEKMRTQRNLAEFNSPAWSY